MQFTKAMTTVDGSVVALDSEDRTALHPKYGTPSYGALIEIPLSSEQRDLLLAIQDRETLHEDVHRSTRSSIDQLGLFGGDSGTTSIEVGPLSAIVHTRVTLVDRDPQNLVLNVLRDLVDGGKTKYMRLLLAPAESKRGERGLSLITDHEIRYDHSQITPEILKKLWLGAPGREMILPFQIRQPMRSTAKKGDFFIGEMNAMDPQHPSSEHLWILRRWVRNSSWGKTSLRHGDAVGFDPYRSVGVRQGEFFATEKSVKTAGLQVVAEQYELDFANSNGDQHKGA